MPTAQEGGWVPHLRNTIASLVLKHHGLHTEAAQGPGGGGIGRRPADTVGISGAKLWLGKGLLLQEGS